MKFSSRRRCRKCWNVL